MKKTSKILALMLALVMLFAMTAFAMGEPSGDKTDSGMPDDSVMANNKDAAVGGTIFTISADGLAQSTESGFDLEGTVTETEADGITLTIHDFTTNGFKVTGGVYTIKNSVITADVDDVVDSNDGGGFCAGVTAGTLIIENCVFTCNGKGGRNGNYTVDCEGQGTMVVINSQIIQTGAIGDPNGYTDAIADPPSNEALTISGYARANMSVGTSKTYYYGSYVETEGWAAMSTDSAQNGFAFYSYDSEGVALYGGYATYADTSCVDWFYGSVLSSAEVGAIISNNGEIHLFNGAAATEDALVYLPADYENTEGYVLREGRSVLEAGRNCVQLHSPDMMGSGAATDFVAILEAEDTDFVTSPDLDQNAILVDWDVDYGPALAEYVSLVKGAVFLTKSTSADVHLTNCTVKSSSGILLMTALNSDSMSRYAKAENDMAGKGTTLTLTDCDISGSVAAYDYQRNATVVLENSTWTGAVETWDKDTWDAAWSADCTADEKCYWILDPAVYHDGTGNGSSLIIDATSVWNPAGESQLVSLTVAAGAVINGTVTVDGKEVDVSKGGSWEGVIVVTGDFEVEIYTGEGAASKDDGVPKDEGMPSDKSDGAPAAAGDVSEAAYQTYLKAFVAAVPANEGYLDEYNTLIDAGDYASFPMDMAFDASWWGYAAMTYDEFVAAGGVYVLPAFDASLSAD